MLILFLPSMGVTEAHLGWQQTVVCETKPKPAAAGRKAVTLSWRREAVSTKYKLTSIF